MATAPSPSYKRFTSALRSNKSVATLRSIIEEANAVDSRWLRAIITNHNRDIPRARDIIRVLLDKGVNPNEMDEHLTMLALPNVLDRPLLDTLLKHGLDVNLQDQEHETPLIDFIIHELLYNEFLYLDGVAGAYNEAHIKEFGDNVLTQLEVFHRLVQEGAELSHADKKGVTPLFHAIHGPYTPRTTPMIEAVLEASDVNRQDSFGETPLMALAQTMPVNLQYGDKTPIQIAQLLLDHGADPTIRDHQGRTAADFISTDMDDYDDNEEEWRRMTELADFLREKEGQGQHGGRRGRKGRKSRKTRKGRKGRNKTRK